MNGLHMRFATDDFVDDAGQREQRVNEGIGGAALAKWLSGEAKASGLDASEPWVEDHGWDFSITHGAATYLCVCTIEDTDEPPREAHVSISKSRSMWDRLKGAGKVSKDDAVVTALRNAVVRRIGEKAVALDWA